MQASGMQVAAQTPSVAWAVVIRGFSTPEQDEVAAVFGHRWDAMSYAAWWNREEVIRYGPESPLRARAEEIDYYPNSGWRPPASPPSGPGGPVPRESSPAL